MDRARLQQTPEIVVNAGEYDRDKHGGVLCVHCRCAVNGVRSYPKNIADEQVVIAAHFRLAANIDHAWACRYNVEKTITRFVANSKAIRKIDADAKPILERVAQGHPAEFRLHILMDAIGKATSGVPQPSPGARYKHREPDESAGADYVRTTRVLKPYFRTAKGILALIARIQKHSDLAALISLKYGDQVIRWDQFFFDTDNYAELYEYLFAEKQKRGPRFTSYPRPISLALKVFVENEPLHMSGEWRVIGRNCVITTKENRGLAIRSVLYFRDRDLAVAKLREPYLLVCGIPRLGTSKPPFKPGLKEHVDISLSVVDPRQVCQYNPM